MARRIEASRSTSERQGLRTTKDSGGFWFLSGDNLSSPLPAQDHSLALRKGKSSRGSDPSRRK
jgi:hypothetical protein